MAGKKQGLTPRRLAFLEAVAACRAEGLPASASHVLPKLEQLGASAPHMSSLNMLAGYALDANLVRVVSGGGKRGGGERIFALSSEGEKALGLEPHLLPVLKNPVCAGTPSSVGDIETTTAERLEEILAFDAKRDLLVPVCGDSMNMAGIFDGDQILVRKLPDGERPKDGQIVVGWMSQGDQSEWTVKYFVSNGQSGENCAFLLFPSSSNPRHRPFLIAPSRNLDLGFVHDARRAHPGWEWLPSDVRPQDCIQIQPELVGMNWVWTRGLIRGPLF